MAIGRKFSDKTDLTAAMLAAQSGADAIKAFAEAGGKFTDVGSKEVDAAIAYQTPHPAPKASKKPRAPDPA
jgi:hypothetical protein